MKRLVVLLFFILATSPAWGANIYVDTTCAAGSTYNPTTRLATGGSDTSYTTVQAGIDGCSVGDTIYLRGGTYNEGNIVIIEAKNGTAWTAGNFTTLTSYPGEWAKIDGQSACDSATTEAVDQAHNCYHNAVIQGDVGQDSGRNSDHPTRYWKFERLEIANGGASSDGDDAGFWFEGGPLWFRYCYIHDCVGANGNTELPSGIWIGQAKSCIIEYNYFKNNGATDSFQGNGANIWFDADYNEDYDLVPDFDDLVAKNIIRYNYCINDNGTKGAESIKIKSQQRFHSEVGDSGTATPTTPPFSPYNAESEVFDPESTWFTTYKTWGDDWHHNIVIGGHINMQQDFGQVHHNISDTGIHLGSFDQTPPLYHMMAYNNTLVGVGSNMPYGGAMQVSSGVGTHSTLATLYPWFRAYNNVISGVASPPNSTDYAFGIHRASETGGAYGGLDWGNFYVERNLFNECGSGDVFVCGHLYSDPNTDGTKYYYAKTVAEFNSTSTADNVLSHTILNWDVDDTETTNELFLGDSGAEQYKTNGAFVISGEITVANGGIGGDHPYLSGVTIPSYVGAVNPSDSDWVAGVISLATTSGFVTAENGSTPSWVEGEGSGSSPTPTCQGISIQ